MIFFLDIDGVFNLDWSGTWDKKSINNFNILAKILRAEAVITSTWKTQYNIKDLQNIFKNQGLNIIILDYTDTINQGDRGEEIYKWIEDNDYDEEFLIIDDKISDIIDYFCDDLIIECKDEKGITEELSKEAVEKYLKQIENNI